MLAKEENREVLHRALVRQTSRRLRAQQPRGEKLKQVTVDVDGLPVEVHGHQEGSAYNGHYGVRMYHPIVASLAETGDLLRSGVASLSPSGWMAEAARSMSSVVSN